ncbi:s-adenosyl-l-methionine-binding protein [Grosmannia clavigera kw1407]|uniref:S-adenosyl-l-methionine-binding protein n=1 Tax=Grosmannia clavigera (strain kw1407 / UAMH 11150) TaxID=655863 RepID=F0XSV4_GROCL|nr:s-adenosyl-l-methionine-binding protein [Grosmannia clavigera kw1407]EFW99319.1 s-adenosyl-l-methionine-binding protein [Grosmannia clavigera kw1407]
MSPPTKLCTWSCMRSIASWNRKKSPVVFSVALRTKSGLSVLFCGRSPSNQPVMSVRFLLSGWGIGHESEKSPFSLDEAKAPVVTVQSASGEEAQSPVPPSPYSVEASPEAAKPIKPVQALGGRKVEKTRLPKGLAHAINSFEQYPYLAERGLQRKYARYAKQLPIQRAVSNKLGYPSHFEAARKGIEVNTQVLDQIALIAREDYQTGQALLEDQDNAEFGLVSGVFAHLSRDWSSQGAKERGAVFPPILEGLAQHFGTNAQGKKILVPGSGMGRLASDLADLGYDVTANEMDYGAILAYHLLANHTTELHQHTLQPFVSDWALQTKSSARYASMTVPDHLPNPAVKLVEGDFLEMFPEDGEFDAVVTLFFIDMADNVINFLSNIHRLLKPGGVWINLGPLKWGSYAALQLSTEEVLQLADLLGFDVDHTSRKNVDSLYGAQQDTLLKFTYVTEFWSALKV